MASEVIIPIVDQTSDEFILLRWLKAEGDEVRAGEPLCEVEASKAVVEVEAPADGLLRRILVEAGTSVSPLAVVALIADADEALPTISAPSSGRQPEASAPTLRPTVEALAGAGEPETASASGQRIVASPRAKRMAAEHGVDLATIRGTGPNGRILEDDVRNAVKTVHLGAKARATLAKAQRVSQSWQTIPHFYTTITVDWSTIVERKRRASGHVTYTDYLALAIAATLKRHPTLNGYWENDGLITLPDVNLGLVVQTERGLVIPVLRTLSDRSLEEIAQTRARLVEQAHAGNLPAAVLHGATFTLSNVGAGHIDQFTAIISPPQVAILSVGSVEPRPFVAGAELAVRPTAILTLGVDHRAIDGRQAAAFLEDLKQTLEANG